MKICEERGRSKVSPKTKTFSLTLLSDRHNSIEDWVISLADSVDTLIELRRKKLHWMYKLKLMYCTVLTKRMSMKRFKNSE